MTALERESTQSAQSCNVGPGERLISVLGGVGLLLSAGRGGAMGRLARSGAALPLLARGVTGYCPIKAAAAGQAPLRAGLKEQWRMLTGAVTAGPLLRTAARRIDSMDAMYRSELQELYSAEVQLGQLANDLARRIGNAPLAFRLQEYATELESRRADVGTLLANLGAEQGGHPDDAMHALLTETKKMAQVCADNVRDAAITASLQRIIHYKIAGYGTIASYAKALGRVDEAARFAQLADRDKSIDTELSELAKETLNPEAVVAPSEQPAGQPESQARPH